MSEVATPSDVRVELLGQIRAMVRGREAPIGSQQQLQLLALLALERGRQVSVERLIDALWPVGPPQTARKTIQVQIHRLREHVGDAIITEPSGYSLSADCAVDVPEFDDLVAAGRSNSDPVAATTAFGRALELWRDEPFGGTHDSVGLEPERARLEELHTVALEGWFDARLRGGAVTDVVPDLERAAAAEPLRDRFQQQLMLALYRAGRQREALQRFQSYRAALAAAGLEPPGDTVDLERRVAASDPSLVVNEERRLRGYTVAERLGEGAFSVVYRGTQPSVGREVAIKQIRAELANRPEFIRRFEAEAHMVAHLEHPHIVPLIDYWREPGSAYLVMRLLRAGSVERSVLAGAWKLEDTLRMVEQIGSALAASHRAGVVHRDVKSANILLDDDGNAYLSDFGIALDSAHAADPASALSAGSPAYASPEQLRREPVGAAADVHGLAIAAYETITSRLPFPDEPNQASLLQRQLNDPIPLVRSSRDDVPTAVDDVLQKATAKSPADRYASVEAFVEEFASAVRGTETPTRDRAAGTIVAADERNPYKGLHAFEEADASDFAGRARLVDQCVEVLQTQRLVAVVGASGSGKSSVVRAGLLPAVRGGRVSGSEDWFVATIVPGARPFEELEAALVRLAADQPPALLDLLTDGERGLARTLRRVLPEDAVLLLVVDQFEELFTMCDDEHERRRFLDAIASALTEDRSQLRVVLTLRADYYDRPLGYESIGRLVRDATVAVLPLAADELEHAIVDPATAVGAEFEPGLVSELVADVSDQPGALPMLQYALTELYERRVSNLITRASYEQIGGLSGAIARTAENLYTAASEPEQAAIRRLFGRLVNVQSTSEDTRRRAKRSELATTPEASAAIDRFGAARLLSFDTDPATREPTVEVAHEALLREWPRFRDWLEQDRESLQLQRHLSRSAEEWDASGRPESELYRGARLEAAEESIDDGSAEPNEVETKFLEASRRRREASALLERNRRVRLQRLLAAVAVIAAVALVASALAIRQQRRAASNEQLAEERATEAEAAREAADVERVRATAFQVLERDPQLAMLLAAQAYRMDPGLESESALHRLLTDTGGLVGSIPGLYGNVWIVDSGTTAIAQSLNHVDVVDLLDRQVVRSFDRRTQLNTEVGVSATARLVVFADADGVQLFSLDTGEHVADLLSELDLGFRVLSAVFSPDGDRLLVSGFDTEELFDISDPADAVSVHSRPRGAEEIRWHPDGESYVVLTVDGVVEYWDLGSDEPRWAVTRRDGGGEFRAEGGSIFSSDGSIVVVAADAGGLTTIIGHSVVDGSVVTAAATHSNSVLDFAWMDEQARTVMATINPGGLTAFDLISGEEVDPPFETDSSWAIEPSDELSLLVEAGTHGLQLWSPDGASPVERRVRRPGALNSPGLLTAAIHRDDTLLVSLQTLPFQPIVQYDLNDPTRPIATDLMGFVVGWHGQTLLVNERMTMLDDDLEPIGDGAPTPLDFRWAGNSADGRFFAVFTASGTVGLHRADGELVADLSIPGAEPAGTATDFSFSGDGTRLVTHLIGGNERWAMWDTETGELLDSGGAETIYRPFLEGDTLYGELAEDFAVVRLDPVTYEPIAPSLVGHNANRSFALESPDGELLYTSSFDNTVRAWDSASGRQLGREIDTPAVDIQISADGSTLVTVTPTHVSLWNYDRETWFDIACNLAARNMTDLEWQEFGPRTREYEATCA